MIEVILVVIITIAGISLLLWAGLILITGIWAYSGFRGS